MLLLMINIVQIGWVHTWYAGWLGYDGASCHAAGTLYFPNLHCSQNFFSSGIIVGNFLQIGLAAIFIFCNWFITGRLRINSYRTPHIFFQIILVLRFLPRKSFELLRILLLFTYMVSMLFNNDGLYLVNDLFSKIHHHS